MSMKIKEAIIATAEYYGVQMSASKLGMFFEDLADLDPDLVVAAYRSFRRDPENKFAPMPAQIRKLVVPDQFVSPEIKAREVASRIIGAISKYGWNNAREAQMEIGHEGWQAVLRQGGWSHLCEQTSKFNELTLQAQLRDQLIGVFKHGAVAIDNAIQISGPRTSELAPANFALIASRDEPKEPA
jgi:hypothetical protein